MLKLGKMTVVAGLMMGVLGLAELYAAEVAVKSGEKIAFMGDSITQAGARPGGYVRLVISGLEANGIKTTAIPAGISGHKSNQMLARLTDRKFLWRASLGEGVFQESYSVRFVLRSIGERAVLN